MTQEDKRSYTITKKDNGWYRVEVIDKYGAWTEVYEKTLFEASKFVYEYWDKSEQRKKRKDNWNQAMIKMIKLDKENGIVSGNRDGLD